MQDVNSIQQFQKLKHTLEEEDKLIRDTENSIKKKEVERKRFKDIHDKIEADLKKAKENFEKVDRELKELVNKKNIMIHGRNNLQNEFKNIERTLEDLKKKGSVPLKF